MQPAWIMIGHVAVTWALVGLIWMVHVVHYPLFASVGPGFRAYHGAHMSRMTIVVAPLMLAEAASALWLWNSPPEGTEGRLWLVSVVLLGIVWLETALFAVPQHGRLASGFEGSVHRALMGGNLVRTLAWTARGVVVSLIAVRWIEPMLRRGSPMKQLDVIVVGAGFGGLAAALHLAEEGAQVALFERTAYPGGCACTFEKCGTMYEGGATLFSGFGEGEIFRRWIEGHSMDVEFEHLDPPLELRSPGGAVLARRERGALLAQFEAIDGAPVEGLRRFFRLQEKVAAALWPTLEDQGLLPPLTPGRMARHALRLPRYLPLVRLAGRPLISVLERFGLGDFQPLVTWLDAQCQITIQCGVREAEAPFALAALDYHHRGAVHVKGGIGQLAWGMSHAIEGQGGTVRFSTAVKSVERGADGLWTLSARGETYRAPWMLFNTLPQDAVRIAGVDHPGLAALANRVRSGWSAAMLYRTLVPPKDAGPQPRHLELVADESAPFLEGNHVFLSIGAEGEGVQHGALRRCTVSTHIDPKRIEGRPGDEQVAYVDQVHGAMRATIRALAPEWDDAVTEFTGSARTFARWTGRSGGLVGGIPRRAGLGQYREVFGRRMPTGMRLVGDSVFPGQSTYAVAAGGVRVAGEVLAALGSRSAAPVGAEPVMPVSPGV